PAARPGAQCGPARQGRHARQRAGRGGDRQRRRDHLRARHPGRGRGRGPALHRHGRPPLALRALDFVRAAAARQPRLRQVVHGGREGVRPLGPDPRQVTAPVAVSLMPLETRREAIVRAATGADHLGYDGFFLPEPWAHDTTALLAATGARPLRLNLPPAPAVPIYLAGLAADSMRLAGELADGWIPFLYPRSRLAEGKAILKEGAARTGAPRELPLVCPSMPAVVAA